MSLVEMGQNGRIILKCTLMWFAFMFLRIRSSPRFLQTLNELSNTAKGGRGDLFIYIPVLAFKVRFWSTTGLRNIEYTM